MGRRLRRLTVCAALPVVLCTGCSDPHSGDWASSTPGTAQVAPSPSQSPASAAPMQSQLQSPGAATPTPDEEPTVMPVSDLEKWLLAGFEEAGYSEANIRVHGSQDAWVGSGSRDSAPERFAHAWPSEKTDLYTDEGTLLRTTTVGGVEVRVLQHVWGVSARFECGQVTVDAYAQSQVEQHQAEAEALSLAGVLVEPLDCAGDGFQG